MQEQSWEKRVLKGPILKQQSPAWCLRSPGGVSFPFHCVALGGPCTLEACVLILRKLLSITAFLAAFFSSVFSVLFLIVLLVWFWTSQIKPLFVLFSDTSHLCVFKSNFWSTSFTSNTPIDVKNWLSYYFHFPILPCFKALLGV